MSLWLESIALRAGSLQNLAYHQNRVDVTLGYQKQSKSHNLKQLLASYCLPTERVYKVRVIYNHSGFVEVSWQPYVPKQWSSFELVEVSTLDYSAKKVDRSCFEQLKEEETQEELILTQGGVITDTTYSNLVFLREGEWFTPSSYLLKGTQRQLLLDHQQIKETKITQDDLASFTHFKLINAMMPLSLAPTYSVDLIHLSSRSFSSSCNGLIDRNED